MLVGRVGLVRAGFALAALLVGENRLPHAPPGSETQAIQKPRDWTTVNVCQIVPGEAVARAVAGTLIETRPFQDKVISRCTYLITLKATGKPAGYIVRMQPETNFEELKKYTDVTPHSGRGPWRRRVHLSGQGRRPLQTPRPEARGFDVRSDGRFGRIGAKGRRRRRGATLEENVIHDSNRPTAAAS